MNFNYDLNTWIYYFIGAFSCCLGMFLLTKILLKKEFKNIKKIKCLLLIPFTIFIIFNTLTFDNILTTFGSLIVFSLMFKYILDEKSGKVFIYSIICYIIFLFGEIFFALIISLFDYLFPSFDANNASRAIYTNVIISTFSCFIAYYLRDKIMYYVEKINKANILINFIQGMITLFVIFSSLNYLAIEKWKFSYKFILIFIIIVGSGTLTYTLMKQYLKNKEVVSKHKMLEEYLKTSADLIEKYSSTVHKYKNNLIVIKSYLKSNATEANKYIDGLLDNMKNRKYSWVSKINYISIDSIRYMIYYKLSKSEELNLKIIVNVSKEIQNIKSDIYNLNELGHILEILGEYFDNANYASNESDLKEINFELYIENNKLVFVISNTYEGNIDLNLIIKNGYTTKGKGHGFGLYDVDKTIKNIGILSNKYEVIDNYFVAKLMIDINNQK